MEKVWIIGWIAFFLIIIWMPDDSPTARREECVKNGMTQKMAVDDIERLCGKAK